MHPDLFFTRHFREATLPWRHTAFRALHLIFWLIVFLVLLLITACARTPSSQSSCPVTPETVTATQSQAEAGEAASQYQVGLWYTTDQGSVP